MRLPRTIVAPIAFVICSVVAAEETRLAVAPRDAFGTTADLKSVSGVELKLSPAEVRLFADVQDGKLKSFSQTEAALLASGVTDDNKRKEYLARIDEIAAAAKKELAEAKSPREQGERLLKFLHAGPMAGGYDSHSTTLADIIEKKKFNCVSSAAFYNIIGGGLGLDLRAVEIPGHGLTGHVFSVLRCDGKLIDVETTNKLGFNIEGKRERPDGVAYDPKEKKSDKREIGTLPLIAVIYYNRGVNAAEKKNHHEAIFLQLCALCLDPTSPSAAKNVIAELTNWGPKLGDEGKFKEGLTVLRIGRQLAPHEHGLINNQKVVWAKYAEAAMARGQEDEALAIARRALQETKTTDSMIVELPVRLYLKPGEALAKEAKWEQAFALATRGAAKLEGKSAKELRDWRAGLFLRWAEAEQKKGNWGTAFGILEKGMADDTTNDRCRGQIAFYAQEWLADAKGNAGKAAERAAALRKQFANVKGVPEVIEASVYRALEPALKADKFEQALKDLRARSAMLANPKKEGELARMVYSKWAKSLEKKDWKQALTLLGQGAMAYPHEKDFAHMADAVCDGVGFKLIQAKKWAEALPIYEEGLKQFPDDSFLKERVHICRKGLGK